jgi:benzoyl-CoA reductase/2-hydroxyglutaryl-CoA dehydratase subunit BcrC/BadD/HgdB
MSSSHIFRYPEEIKADFVKTDGLEFKNGKKVSTAEIWDFMTIDAPKRFPNAFDRSRRYYGGLSNDVTFFTGIKLGYMALSFRDRLLEAHDNGTPIIHVAGGQTVDPYFAAGGIPIVPGPLRGWARDIKEGLTLREADQVANEILEAGRITVSIDACNNPIGSISAISKGIVPVDLIAPYLNLRCTDIGFSIEAYRNKFKNIPFTLIDYPITQDKESAVEYFAAMLRRLIKQIGEIRGKEATEEDLWNEIRLENKGRRFAREVTELVWAADLPPVQSSNFGSLITTGRFSSGDSLAATQLLEQATVEIRERIKNSVLAHGVSPDPVRLLASGSCFGLNGDFVEAKGGLLVGTDDHLSKIYADVEESGDPYVNLAKAALTYNYEKPAEQRARYVVDLVRKSRADGVVCGFNWGCNYQSATSRLVADIVKKETGVPTINIEVAELGRSEATEQTQNRIESFIEVLKSGKEKKAA